MVTTITGSPAPVANLRGKLLKAREALLDCLDFGSFRPSDPEYDEIDDMVKYLEDKLGI